MNIKIIFYLVKLSNQYLEPIVFFVLRTDMDAKNKLINWNICFYSNRKLLTVKCWNNHARIIFVATFGKIPRFFWRFFELSSRSSSPPVLSPPEPTLLSKLSPLKIKQKDEFNRFKAQRKVKPNVLKEYSSFPFHFFL